jgi:biopolymer transport protein ExbD
MEYGGDIPILVFADKNLTHQDIEPVLNLIRDVGFPYVNFVVIKEGDNQIFLIRVSLNNEKEK